MWGVEKKPQSSMGGYALFWLIPNLFFRTKMIWLVGWFFWYVNSPMPMSVFFL